MKFLEDLLLLYAKGQQTFGVKNQRVNVWGLVGHGVSVVMGFRTYYPKRGHLGILNILSQRNFKKQQKQEGHSGLPLLVLFPESGRKTLM